MDLQNQVFFLAQPPPVRLKKEFVNFLHQQKITKECDIFSFPFVKNFSNSMFFLDISCMDINLYTNKYVKDEEKKSFKISQKFRWFI